MKCRPGLGNINVSDCVVISVIGTSCIPYCAHCNTVSVSFSACF